MITDENHNIYCPVCLVRTEFVIDLGSYTCDRCEGIFVKEELLNAKERSIIEFKQRANMRQRPLGEFL